MKTQKAILYEQLVQDMISANMQGALEELQQLKLPRRQFCYEYADLITAFNWPIVLDEGEFYGALPYPTEAQLRHIFQCGEILQAFLRHMYPALCHLFPGYAYLFTLTQNTSRTALILRAEADYIAAAQWSEITANMFTRSPMNEPSASSAAVLHSATRNRFREVLKEGGESRMRDRFDVKTPKVIDGVYAPGDISLEQLDAGMTHLQWNAQYWQVMRPVEVHDRKGSFLTAYKRYKEKMGGVLPVYRVLP